MSNTFVQKKPYGFTLIELMAALVITGIVIAPMYIITRGMADQTNGQRVEIEAVQQARIGLSMLEQDISRAGLFASPSTLEDPISFNNELSGSDARYRNAIVHLNRDAAGDDALLLAGNFLGGQSYPAFYSGGGSLVLEGVQTPDECLRQFDPAFAFAHIIAPSKRTLDVRVTGIPQFSAAGLCTVTINSAQVSSAVFLPGDSIRVAANQTLLYWVEDESLVRYFVAYDSPNSVPADAECTVTGALTVDDVVLPGGTSVIKRTRQVVARNVNDFQVWFRPVTNVSGRPEAHTHSPAELLGNSGNFPGGYLMDPQNYMIPNEASDNSLNGQAENGSCSQAGSTAIGSENIRSVLVRLAVRPEMTDQKLNFDAYDPNSTVVENTLAPYTGGDPEAAGAGYRLRTMTSEIVMPNLATRVDLVMD